MKRKYTKPAIIAYVCFSELMASINPGSCHETETKDRMNDLDDDKDESLDDNLKDGYKNYTLW